MCLLKFSLCTLIALSLAYGHKPNNVCPTFQDYENINNNKRCWHNPDVTATPEAIAKRYGYILETHNIITSDGYVLELNRLVSPNGTTGTQPVLIHHGLCTSAVFWLLNGKLSMPFYITNFGYDVWLSNARGSDPSLKHVNMTIDDPKYWDFSFHEMALFDIPVTLEYIRKKNDGKRVIFIGHSMGGTIQYVYASTMPNHAKENVAAIISLAPVVFTDRIKATPALLLIPYVEFLTNELKMINFYGSGSYPQLKRTAGNICSGFPYISTCNQILEALCGKSEGNVLPELMPLFFRRYPASFSAKTLTHFGQAIGSGGRFQMFDYGARDNLQRYNSIIPPEYDVKKINVPVYIIFGEADLLSTKEDNLKLFESLRTEKYITSFSGTNNNIPFQHNDFEFSRHFIEFDQYLVRILKRIQRKAEINKTFNKPEIL